MEYSQALRQTGVQGLSGLLQLTDARLEAAGVLQAEHRVRILDAIAALQPEKSQGDSPSTSLSEAPTGILVRATPPGTESITEPGDEDPGLRPVSVQGRGGPGPAPWGLDEEASGLSLDSSDGAVDLAVEADDTTEEPPQVFTGREADFSGPADTDDGLGKMLLLLLVLVVLAGGGGFLVIEGALKSNDVVSVAPIAKGITPVPPVVVRAPGVGSPGVVALPEPEPEPEPRAEPEPRVEPASTVRPSFPCGRAESRVELLICGSAELASLDRRMAVAYRSARGELSTEAFAELRAAQQRWLRSRDACTDEICVAERYRERLAEVE